MASNPQTPKTARKAAGSSCWLGSNSTGVELESVLELGAGTALSGPGSALELALGVALALSLPVGGLMVSEATPIKMPQIKLKAIELPRYHNQKVLRGILPLKENNTSLAAICAAG